MLFVDFLFFFLDNQFDFVLFLEWETIRPHWLPLRRRVQSVWLVVPVLLLRLIRIFLWQIENVSTKRSCEECCPITSPADSIVGRRLLTLALCCVEV